MNRRFNPDIHHRRSIRLKGYDYSQVGAYFVTICTQNRECLFGDIADGEMVLNDAGQMILDLWTGIPSHNEGVGADAFIVMPNHIHGIITLESNVGAGHCARPGATSTTSSVSTVSLADVVGRFKSLTTHRYRNGVTNKGWLALDMRLWQRNYYERIIRNEDELTNTREYIVNNPLKWPEDENNPMNF